MRASRMFVRVSIGAVVGLLIAPAFAQTGVRLNPRGGVRIGSPSAGAMSKNPVTTRIGPNIFEHGFGRGDFGHGPRAIHGDHFHGDRLHIDGRLLDEDVRFHFGDHTGFGAHGHFKDDDFSLRFHLGDHHLGHDLLHHRRRHVWVYPRYAYPYYPYYRSYEPGYPIGYGTTYVNQPVVRTPPPPPPPTAITEPQTPLEQGIAHLWLGEVDDAIRVLNGVVAADDADANTQRILGLALLQSGRVADGVAMMRAAYDNDPALGLEPIDGSVLGPDAEEDLAQLVRRVSLHANKSRSASGWLTLAALMQGQGRTERAGMMLGRAVDAGLERAKADAFGLPMP